MKAVHNIFEAMDRILLNSKFGYITGKYKSWHRISLKVMQERLRLLSSK